MTASPKYSTIAAVGDEVISAAVAGALDVDVVVTAVGSVAEAVDAEVTSTVVHRAADLAEADHEAAARLRLHRMRLDATVPLRIWRRVEYVCGDLPAISAI